MDNIRKEIKNFSKTINKLLNIIICGLILVILVCYLDKWNNFMKLQIA